MTGLPHFLLLPAAALALAAFPLASAPASPPPFAPHSPMAASLAFPDPPSGFAHPAPASLHVPGALSPLPAHARRHAGYQWPTGAPAQVLRPFDRPAQRWMAGHRGVDLALGAGQTVLAAGAGEVVYAGRLNDRSVISIRHGDGIRTTYEPVEPCVRRGDKVEAGAPIGTLEPGHCEGEACLHWGAKRDDDDYLDPLGLLDRRRIRILE